MRDDSLVESNCSREPEVIEDEDGDLSSHLATAFSGDKDIRKGISALSRHR